MILRRRGRGGGKGRWCGARCRQAMQFRRGRGAAAEMGADLGELGAGSRQLCLGQGELGLGFGIIEPGQHIALLDPHAFLNQDFGHFPGDLGRHRSLTPRRDVAAGVQHRAHDGLLARRARHCSTHRKRLRQSQNEPEQAASKYQEHTADQHDPASVGTRGFGVATVNMELLEQFRFFHTSFFQYGAQGHARAASWQPI